MDSFPLLSLDPHVLCNVLEQMPFNNLISLRKTCHFVDEFVRENRKRLYKRMAKGFYLKMVIAEKPQPPPVEQKPTLFSYIKSLFTNSITENKKEIRIYFIIDYLKNSQMKTVYEGDLRIIDLPFEFFYIVSRVDWNLSTEQETLVIDCLRRMKLSVPAIYVENLLQTTTLKILSEVNCQKEITLNCIDHQNQLEMERKITRGPSKIVFNVTKEVKPNDNEIFHSLTKYSHVEIDAFCPSLVECFLNGLFEAEDLVNFQTASFVMSKPCQMDQNFPWSLIWSITKHKEDNLNRCNVPSLILRMSPSRLSKWVFLIIQFTRKRQYFSCYRIEVTNCDMEEQMALLSRYFMDSECCGDKFRTFLKLPVEERKAMGFFHNC